MTGIHRTRPGADAMAGATGEPDRPGRRHHAVERVVEQLPASAPTTGRVDR